MATADEPVVLTQPHFDGLCDTTIGTVATGVA